MNKTIIESAFISIEGMAEDALDEGNQSRATLLKMCGEILRGEIVRLLKIEADMIILREMYNRNSLGAYGDDTHALGNIMQATGMNNG